MTYKVSKLYYLAEKYYRKNTEEEEIIQIDMTEDLLEELKLSIQQAERNFIEIHGNTRGGKSTVAIALGQIMWNYMKESPKYQVKGTFGMNNIARDQSERVRKLLNPETNHTVIITDEDNELEKTGANSTSNEALQKTISDIHAGRYVHEIMISPRDFLDPNTQIVLNTIPSGIDREEKTIFCKLYYRFWEGTLDHTQLIGHVNIYVGDLINTWINEGQEHFFAPKPILKHYENNEDKTYIKDCITYTKIKEQLKEICKKRLLHTLPSKKIRENGHANKRRNI